MMEKIKNKRLLRKYQKLLNKKGVVPNTSGNKIIWILDTTTNKTYYPKIEIAIVR